MAKVYLNIQVDGRGLAATVVRTVISRKPAWQVPGGTSLDRFWATVDEWEAETFAAANEEMRNRLQRAAKKLPGFRALQSMLAGDTPATPAGGTCDSAVPMPRTEDVEGG